MEPDMEDLPMTGIRRFVLAVLLALSPLAFATEAVNVNTADAATLSAGLVGVGPAKAKAIVAFREANGPFKSVEELAAVKGIGARTVDLNRDKIALD